MIKSKAIVFITLSCFLLLVSCDKPSNNITVRICYSTSYGSAPLQILMMNKKLENSLPENVSVEWVNINTASYARDALITGEVDIAVLSAVVSTISIDNGLPIEILGNSTSQSALFMSNSADILSFDDVKENHKIAVSSRGASFDLALMAYSKEKYGEADKFNSNLIVMQNTDIVASLKSSADIDAAIIGFPFNKVLEKMPSIRTVFDFSQILYKNNLGIFVVSNKSFYENNPKIIKILEKNLAETLDFMNNSPKNAAAILCDYYGNDIEAEDIEAQIKSSPISFYIDYSSYQKAVELMYEVGMITNLPEVFISNNRNP